MLYDTSSSPIETDDFLQLLIEDTVQCIRMSALCNGKWICLAQSPIPHKEPPPSKFLTSKNNFPNKNTSVMKQFNFFAQV